MGRANVYLPDELERRVKAAGIPISAVCQRALAAAVDAAEGGRSLFGPEVDAPLRAGWDAGVSWAGAAPQELLLRLLRDQALADIPADALPPDLYALTGEQTLAWEAGFLEGARDTVRTLLPATVLAGGPPPSVSGAGSEPAEPQSADGVPPAEGVPAGSSSSSSATPTAQTEPDDSESGDEAPSAHAESSSDDEPPPLGDDAGRPIGVTVDGVPVSFDPHAAVRANQSALYAVLGPADLRARLTLNVAQDAAARGTAVVLVDLSGSLISRASGLGRTVRIVRQPGVELPQLDDLVQGAVGLGGLWGVLSRLSSSTGLGQVFAEPAEQLLEPGYVTVLGLSGDNPLGAAVTVARAAQALARPAGSTDYPRLLHVDLPSSLTVPAGASSRIGRILRTAREHEVAIGLSAESADTLIRISSGAMLSTVFAFATSSPAEAGRLRDLLGADAPILVDPPGTTVTPGDDAWAVMRDRHGRLGQIRIDRS
jgi:hypothetical protein